MQTVAIVGVGLIGGSFALALRQAGFSGRILGVSSPETLTLAQNLQVIDEGATLEAAVRAADLIYLAQPVRAILDTLPQLAPWIQPAALVTDAGSTKAAIVTAASACLPAGQFLGGHPMAGKESTGVKSAEANLFYGRPYLLTPAGGAVLESQSTQDFLKWLELIGACVHLLGPEEHDRVVASTSHVPQLASTALALLVSERLRGVPIEQLAGPGLRSMTRLAASGYNLWGDILDTNASEIGPALEEFITLLQRLRTHLCSPTMAEEFANANVTAAKLLSVTGPQKKSGL